MHAVQISGCGESECGTHCFNPLELLQNSRCILTKRQIISMIEALHSIRIARFQVISLPTPASTRMRQFAKNCREIIKICSSTCQKEGTPWKNGHLQLSSEYQ
jgi:hypothetical protein